MGDTYEGSFACSNCGWQGIMDVQKGTTMNEHAQNNKCLTCGCLRLFKLS